MTGMDQTSISSFSYIKNTVLANTYIDSILIC